MPRKKKYENTIANNRTTPTQTTEKIILVGGVFKKCMTAPSTTAPVNMCVRYREKDILPIALANEKERLPTQIYKAALAPKVAPRTE